MSRIPPKWKVEKAKVKVVFRLQFHATHIPQSGWDKLFLSFIPLDTGKPTAKTNKASVKNGNCKWSDPIYETTRLLQDPRTKKYDDKLYKLVVAMGSSRSCLLGDVSINLADFADASKPSSVALPLHSCDFGTILHVTVQLLTSKTGFREFEQQRELSVKGFQPLPGQRIHNPGEIATVSSPMGNEQMDKVNAKVRFKEESPELHSFEKVGKSNEDYEDLAAGIDGSSNTSESLHAEKNDFSSANEVDSLRSAISGDAGVLLISQSPRTDRRLSTQGSNEWTHGWSSDYSADNDLAPAYEENNRLRARLEVVESAFLQLKTEAKSLQSLTSELGVETQSLAEQLVLELASGEKLTKEVSLLKSECYKFKSDLEELRSTTAMQCVPGRTSSLVTTKCHPADTLSMDGNNFPHILQTKWLQDLLLIEEKVKEIQNKACLAYHGSGVDFLHSDLKLLDRHLQNLKQCLTTGTSLALVEGSQLKAIQLPRVVLSEQFNHGQWLEGSYNPDAMIQCLGNAKEHKKNADAAGVAEETMCELLQKLEDSKTENINLAKKMGQMECYYEAFIQELEDNRQQAVNELENLRTEHSSCLYTISALQSQVEKLGQDMNEQFIRFAADRHDLDSLNKELEKKAIVSESALKRVRWNYAVAVDRLQKDLELLSFQVLSMYETNENLAKQALADVSQIFCPEDREVSEEPYRSGIRRIQSESISTKTDCGMSQIDKGVSDKAGYKDLYNSDFIDESESVLQRGLHNNLELQTKDNRTYLGVEIEDTSYTDSQNKAIQVTGLLPKNGLSSATLKNHSQDQYGESDNRWLVDKVGPEDMTTPHILKEPKSDTKVEPSEIPMLSIHWELFTQVLQETLRDVNDGVKNMMHKMVELTQQLEDSSAENESLMLKWHNTLEEARVSRKDEIKIRSEYDDLMMRNHILEAKLRDVSDKNTSLSQKIAKYMVECQVHESKYESCLIEKNQFEEMLKVESLQKSCLETEISSTVEGFKALQEEFNKQSSAHSDLQNTTYKLQEKLRFLYSSMVSCNEEIHGSTVHVMSSEEKLESDNHMALLSHLEHFQHEVHKEILQLRKEKQEIEGKNDVAVCSLNEAKSQILDMEQNFESEMGEITRKLALANALVGKLNLELEDVREKLKFSLEAEERSTLKNKELLSKLTILEVEIQQVSDENRDLAQKLLLCNSVSEELENTKSSLTGCMQENRDLMVSIESAKVSSIQMEDKVSQLKECLRCAHDEMQLEGRLRKELEATVQDLNLQLSEKVQQLLFSDEQKTELDLLRERVLDLEKELHYVLLSTEESQRKQNDKTSSFHLQVSELENELAGTLDYSLNTDVKVAYMRSQFRSTIQALVDQNKALQGDLEVGIQQVSDENRDLAQKLLLCNTVCEELENTKSSLMDCMQENRDLMVSIESAKVASIQMEDEINRLKECLGCAHDEMQLEGRLRKELETTVQDLTLQLTQKVQQLLFSDEQKTELVLLRKRVLDLEKELHYVLSSTEESQRNQNDETSSLRLQVSELENELAGTLDHSLNTDVKVAYMRNQFRSTIQALVDKNRALQGDMEVLNLKHVDMVTSVESHMVREARLLAENARLSTDFQSLKAECELVSHEKDGLIAQINEQGGVWADLENELEGTLQNSLNTDVKVAYMKSQFQFLIQALVDQNNALHRDLEELNQKHVDIVTSLEAHMVGKARLLAENARLSESFQSLNAECELISHEKEGLIAQINEKTAVWADTEDLKVRYSVVEACHSQEKLKFEDDACCLRNMVVSLEEEVDSLRSSRVELETTVVILTSKLDEQRNQMSLFENCNHELKKLREQYNELTFKLSEQILKTEEFKNLSIHLRELKDKADAECLQARQRREADGSSFATQESLRIALIKEQCESKVQEVTTQLCASKRYAEEMLLKLQNALDEIESRKKKEAVLLKRNEEFSVTISNMESELRTNIADKRELVKDCDRMKAELECTTLSLDCCKEEKLKLEVYLQECIEERTRTRVELDLVKRLLENLASSSSDSEVQKIYELGHQDTTSIGQLLEDHSSQSSAHNLQQACSNRTSHLSLQPKLLDLQDGLLARHTTEEGTLTGTEAEQFADISENFKERQRLMTGMDLLHKELERLKNDNLSPLLPLEGHHIDPTLQHLESELSQLDKANDQLKSISPLFKELPGSGNALQRVLAMEVELAETLQLKKSSEVLKESPFLKQHNDEEAVFRSFKDINELIKQMLESRRRYAAVEAELTEIQGRYTQLSLKFAEVEGERQQLAMTLKTRTPKKPETPQSRALE